MQRQLALLTALCMGLLAAIAVHLCSAAALQTAFPTEGGAWKLQAVADALGFVLGSATGYILSRP